jgi:hypothetical protein
MKRPDYRSSKKDNEVKVPDEAYAKNLVAYIREFDRANSLMPCTYIVHGKRVDTARKKETLK